MVRLNSSVPELEVYLTSTCSKKAPSTLSLNLAHQNLKNNKSSESRGNFKGNKQAVHEIITTNQHNQHVRIKKTSLDINHCFLGLSTQIFSVHQFTWAILWSASYPSTKLVYGSISDFLLVICQLLCKVFFCSSGRHLRFGSTCCSSAYKNR